uniref:Uncharacterized protein n=1 Tax=Oryza barthii TaxID=65489 RepID=A0A0D3F152_9ORYZ
MARKGTAPAAAAATLLLLSCAVAVHTAAAAAAEGSSSPPAAPQPGMPRTATAGGGMGTPSAGLAFVASTAPDAGFPRLRIGTGIGILLPLLHDNRRLDSVLCSKMGLRRPPPSRHSHVSNIGIYSASTSSFCLVHIWLDHPFQC